MKYKLSQLVEIIGGGTPKTTNPEYWGGSIPWLSVKDFNNNNRYVYSTEKSITEKGLASSSTCLLQKDDIIISARGTVGGMASIPFPMAFNQSCYGLRARREIVDTDFLYYLVKFKVKELKHNSHGSVFDTITRDTFDGIVVEIPNLLMQRKIGQLLANLDEKIELNNAINDNLSNYSSTESTSISPDISFGNKASRKFASFKFSNAFAATACISGSICSSNEMIDSIGGNGNSTLNNSCWFRPGCAAFPQASV